uniref:Uncharacterized protein ycf33 n=1 Tax=Taenioma perpusillum TaxID=210852 RepID=A0A1Z1MRT8_9FLOR|nr:hypothetical protein [Taenioma perpusillum]ARW68579.1 hypothetical protein [Taenioma perpusillum]
MNNFLDNLYKFPRFLLTILIGFFLTTLKPIFKSLKNKKSWTIFSTIIILIIYVLYLILKLMTN